MWLVALSHEHVRGVNVFEHLNCQEPHCLGLICNQLVYPEVLFS